MKFLELNKKRHAVKSFNEKKVDYHDLKTAIDVAILAPSAHNIQPWKFVIVDEKKDALAEVLPAKNKVQVQEASYVVALFSDTDLVQRSRKIARIGAKSLSDEMITRYMEILPAQFQKFNKQDLSDYLALNAGLVAMNLVFALTDQGIGSNMILGFDKSKLNGILDIDERFRPELLITVGYHDNVIEPSYRLPIDNIIEKR